MFIPAYEVRLREEAHCEYTTVCKVVNGNPTVNIGIVYRSPNSEPGQGKQCKK